MKFTFADFLLIVGFLMLVVPMFFIDIIMGSILTGALLIVFSLNAST